jgi:hypothetical protein
VDLNFVAIFQQPLHHGKIAALHGTVAETVAVRRPLDVPLLLCPPQHVQSSRVGCRLQHVETALGYFMGLERLQHPAQDMHVPVSGSVTDNGGFLSRKINEGWSSAPERHKIKLSKKEHEEEGITRRQLAPS